MHSMNCLSASRAAGIAGAALMLSACGFLGDSSSTKSHEPLGSLATPVPRASCGPGSQPEPGLQGQVPLADRDSGRSRLGYWCNLELVGQWKGDGAAWQFAWYDDCAYYSTAYFPDREPDQEHVGVVVIDGSKPTRPVPSAYLDTAAMLDPWESLKVNEKRLMLGGVNGIDGGGGPEIDLYDISGDCRQPQLVTSMTPQGDTGSTGHAGDFAPDGLTYYSANRAIGIEDPEAPYIAGTITGGLTHDLSIREDGNRAYLASIGNGGYPPHNGLVIVDTSQIQARAPEPQTPIVGALVWEDGGLAQNADPIFIGGKPYVLFTDENGPYTLASLVANGTADRRAACAQQVPPFAMGRLIDISNERLPVLASRLMLEIHDPANCDATLADVEGTGIFQYDAHYCTADDPADTTAVACGHFQSGIRVFDVRDPTAPKEIAYFNPPAQEGRNGTITGSHHDQRENGTTKLTADWCSANVRFRRTATGGELWTSCQDNGFLLLRFTNGAWPFRK
jgi:hypothetical protein